MTHPARSGRRRRELGLFVKFGLVGASGVLVNLITLVVVKRLGHPPDLAVLGLPIEDFHVRWYHVYSTAAFLVANLWNFQLNRSWTFRTAAHARWWREYWPFLTVGLLGQLCGLVLLTLLMHPGSVLTLPTDVLDDSSGLRTRLYWAQLAVIVLVTPLSFLLNRVWTFTAVRVHHQAAGPPATPGSSPALPGPPPVPAGSGRPSPP